MIKHVQQKHKHGCILACLAMVFDQDYQTLVNWYQELSYHKKDFDKSGLILMDGHLMLALKGYSVQSFTRYRFGHLLTAPWPPEPFAPLHLCHVQDKVNGVLRSHCVIMDGQGVLYDPNKLDSGGDLVEYSQVNSIDGIFPAPFDSSSRTN